MIREWNEESLDHRNTLLYAMGISEEDAKRPIIGLLNTWNEMNPGHFPFDKELIAEMKKEIYQAGGLALELPISGICDGICSNTPGDRYTLPARDMVSSEVETVAELNMLEGMVMMATCDKVVPGMLMGALRVNIPTVMMTGGYMAAGHYQGRMLSIDTHKTGLCSVYRRRYVGRGLQRHCAQCMSNTGGMSFYELRIRCVQWQKFLDFLLMVQQAAEARQKNGMN